MFGGSYFGGDYFGSYDPFSVYGDSHTHSADEVIAVSDNYTALMSFFNTINESIIVVGSYARAISLFRALSEAVSLVEAYARQINYHYSITHVISLIPGIGKGGTRTLQQSVTIADTASSTTVIARVYGEIINLVEATVDTIHDQLQQYFETLSEIITPAENFNLTRHFARVHAEIILLPDTIAEQAARFRAYTQSISLVEVFNARPTLKIFLETITVNSERVATYVRNLSEAIALSYTYLVSVVKLQTLSEVIQLIYSSSVRSSLVRAFTEAIPLNHWIVKYRNGVNMLWRKIPKPRD